MTNFGYLFRSQNEITFLSILILNSNKFLQTNNFYHTFLQISITFIKFFVIPKSTLPRENTNTATIFKTKPTIAFIFHLRRKLICSHLPQDEYEKLSCKIKEAVQKSAPPFDLTGEFAEFSNIERKNHPTIIKAS